MKKKNIIIKVLCFSMVTALVSTPILTTKSYLIVNADSEEDTSGFKEVLPIITSAGLKENDAKAGAVLATLSLPEGEDKEGVTYELLTKASAADKYYSLARYTTFLEIDGDKVIIRKDLDTAEIPSEYKEMLSTHNYNDGKKRLASGFISFGVVAKKGDDTSKQTYAYGENFSKPYVEIKEREYVASEEGEDISFNVKDLLYYIGEKGDYNSIEEKEWKHIDNESLKALNATNGDFSNDVDVIGKTPLNANEVVDGHVFLKAVFDKEGPQLFNGVNNKEGKYAYKDLSDKGDKRPGEEYLDFGIILFSNGEGGFSEQFHRKFNFKLATLVKENTDVEEPGNGETDGGNTEVEDNNFSEVVPVITRKELKENDAIAGAVLATLSLPEGENQEGVTYELLENLSKEDGGYDLSRYNSFLEVVGNEVRIREDLDTTEDISSDYNDSLSSYNYGDGKKRLASGELFFGVVAKKDNATSKPVYVHGDNIKNPYIIGEREYKPSEDGEDISFMIKDLVYYIGEKADYNSIEDKEWKHIAEKSLEDLNNTNGKFDSSIDIVEKTSLSANDVADSHVFVKAVFDKKGPKLVNGVNKEAYAYKELTGDKRPGEEYLSFGIVLMSNGEGNFQEQFHRRFNFKLATLVKEENTDVEEPGNGEIDGGNTEVEDNNETPGSSNTDNDGKDVDNKDTNNDDSSKKINLDFSNINLDGKLNNKENNNEKAENKERTLPNTSVGFALGLLGTSVVSLGGIVASKKRKEN